jgi:hypothetical protein
MDDFEQWQRKFLMHAMWVARTINPEAGIESAARLEAIGAPLLFGLTDRVRVLVAKDQTKGTT